MDLAKFGLFQTLSQRINWLTQRQDVLAQNIANADTPKYRPQDLEPFAAHLRSAGRGRMTPTVTHVAHIQAASGPGAARSQRQTETYETSPSGNEVILEQQLMQVSETAAQHQLALNLYTKHIGLLRTALGRGR
ncbi:MAG: flagellar basal body rod protein FlgB [Inquilinaceae bacterium]